MVLGEIAAKTLSLGVNDADTAIDVIGTLVRVLMDRAPGDENHEIRYDFVSAPKLHVEMHAPNSESVPRHAASPRVRELLA
ncbi:MAG: DUF2254 domain-containing protein [Candidatus Devosia symbiotica]|nr:DUF2254 domain-containing protein [Candidatus Devosia symbiotica]